MILQSLAELAQRQNLVEDSDYEQKEVHWAIDYGPNGQFIGLSSLLEQTEERRQPRGLRTKIPRRSGRTSGDAAEFMVDKREYVLGVPGGETGDLDRAAKRQRLFIEAIRAASVATHDPAVGALVALLEGPQHVGAAREACAASAAAENARDRLLSDHLIAFRYEPDGGAFIHERAAVRQYWHERLGAGRAVLARRRCVITGDTAEAAQKYPVVKGIPPVSLTRGGVHLSAVDKDSGAFASYGWKGNDNVPISVDGALAYTTALNRLLSDRWLDPQDESRVLPEQRVQLSDDTVAVFWADSDSVVPALVAPAVAEAAEEAVRAFLGTDGAAAKASAGWKGLPEDAETPAVSPVADTLAAPYTGTRPSVDDPSMFRILILSGGQGRAAVRTFHSQTVGHTVSAVRQWFDDLRLAGSDDKKPLWRLLRAAAVRGEQANLSPGLVSDVFLDILAGRPLPRNLLVGLLQRCRHEPDRRDVGGTTYNHLKVTPDRATLIKACLNRQRRMPLPAHYYPEVKPVLDESNVNRGYLLGRMFACVERMQELALGDVNSTVTDRYFGAACATPQAVFPRLLKGEVHHFAKAKEGERAGSAVYLHRLLGQLSNGVLAAANPGWQAYDLAASLKASSGRIHGFPSFLALEEQGLFVLGYHQQRNEFFRPRSERPGSAEDVPSN